MKVLCLGGTGTVGSQVLERLTEREVPVRCLSRSASGPRRDAAGVQFVPGDLGDPASLTPAFEGIDRVHLLTPLHPDEATLGRHAIDAALEAGVERVVLHSVHHAERATEVPHFRSKVRMMEALDVSALDWMAIEPNNYFQNDLWLEEPLVRSGLYPTPVGDVGLSRVDVSDIAEATVNALLDDELDQGRFPLVGPEVLTGADMARAWSEALDRPVRYVGDDLDAWEAASRKSMPEWMVSDLRLMFQHFLDHGLAASEDDLERQARVLRRPPRSFADFTRATARAWGGSD